MNAHTIFERDLNGEMVSPSDPGYDELINAIWDTMKMATELNTGYHTPDEVRGLRPRRRLYPAVRMRSTTSLRNCGVSRQK